MKISTIYVYPVKGLRAVEVTDTLVGPQGVQYDRTFMLLSTKRTKTNTLEKMQLARFPECALFSQTLDVGGGDGSDDGSGDAVVVRYHPPTDTATQAKDVVMSPVEHPPLRIPLHPTLASLEPLDVDLHGSGTRAYRMGPAYDAWFSACFGFDVILTYIGDGQRKVLGSTLPPKTSPVRLSRPAEPTSVWAAVVAWLAAVWTALLGFLGVASAKEEPWIAFTDCAPLLVTSASSLANVGARMSDGVDVPMYKFRPNIVVDGADEDAWAEDYWAELTVQPRPGLSRDEDDCDEKDSKESTPGLSRSSSMTDVSAASVSSLRLLLTGNCARCTSLNVDYDTGRPASGELGEVLKRLSKDRRVDTGIKYSPVFGRYAFVDRHADDGAVRIAVGDEVHVTRRNADRTTWDWPGL